MSIVLTRDDLARMYPRAPAPWVDAFVKIGPALCDFYNVGRPRWVHLAGQMAEETDGLTLSPMQEDMRFSVARMLQVYDYRLGLLVALTEGLLHHSAACLVGWIKACAKVADDFVERCPNPEERVGAEQVADAIRAIR